MSGRIAMSTAVVLGLTLLALAFAGMASLDTRLASAAKVELRLPHRVEQVRFEHGKCSPVRDLGTHL